MLLHGADKAEATRRLTHAETYDPSWPATIFTECAEPLLFTDRAAIDAAALTSAH